MAFVSRLVVLIALCWIRFGTCAVNRDRTVFTKLTILEDEIIAMKSSIQRNEVSRKADIDILRQDINIKLESIVAKVLSEIIDDKSKAGEIRGVVEGSVNSLLQHQQHQLQQLKGLVRSVGTRQPRPVPRKADDSSRKVNKRFRVLNKKVKNYETQIKELRDEILHQNLQILEFKSEFSEKMDVLEELRRKREQKREMERNPSTTTATATSTSEMQPVDGVGASTSINFVTRTVDVGDRVDLKCVASGYPRPTVIWSKLKGAVPSNALVSDNVLIIPEIGGDDAGTYRCTATNTAGTTEQRVRLYVRGSTKEVCEGSTAVLRCSYTETEDTVSWKRGNGGLVSVNKRVYIADRRFSVQRPYFSEWNLKINSVTFKDAGIYVCYVDRRDFTSKFSLKVKSC